MKTMFKIYGILIISVLFAFTACEGPMGPAGADGSEFTTTIPESSGLRGTTWVNSAATDGGVNKISFDANGEGLTYVRQRTTGDQTMVTKVITYSTVTTTEFGTTHFIERLTLTREGGTAIPQPEDVPGRIALVSFHMKDGELRYEGGINPFTKQ